MLTDDYECDADLTLSFQDATLSHISTKLTDLKTMLLACLHDNRYDTMYPDHCLIGAHRGEKETM